MDASRPLLATAQTKYSRSSSTDEDRDRDGDRSPTLSIAHPIAGDADRTQTPFAAGTLRHTIADPSSGKLLLLAHEVAQNIGDESLFSRVSLSVGAGETHFIVGPSGCGKSMLLRALARLDPIPSGTIRSDLAAASACTDDNAFSDDSAPAWRANMLYVSQSRITRPGSPRDLFATATRFAAQRARTHRHTDLDAAARSCGLTAMQLDQMWSTLSGGQAQRALLAISLATNPAVLLLGTVRLLKFTIAG
jgi:ABC-type iron transport system FetAB ATPase subunit